MVWYIPKPSKIPSIGIGFTAGHSGWQIWREWLPISARGPAIPLILLIAHGISALRSALANCWSIIVSEANMAICHQFDKHIKAVVHINILALPPNTLATPFLESTPNRRVCLFCRHFLISYSCTILSNKRPIFLIYMFSIGTNWQSWWLETSPTSPNSNHVHNRCLCILCRSIYISIMSCELPVWQRWVNIFNDCKFLTM